MNLFLISIKTINIISLVFIIVLMLAFSLFLTFVFKYYYKKNKDETASSQLDDDVIFNLIKIEKNKTNKPKKVLKIFGKILSWIIFIGVGGGFIFSIVSRATGNTLMFGDSSYIVIASGSMEKVNPSNSYLWENNLNNQIKTYDTVKIKKINNQDELKLYDIIAFKSNDGRTIVHRIIDIRPDNTYITKGDANENEDAYNLYGESLSYDKIVGVYTGDKIPFIGMFVIFLQSNNGIVTIISLIYILIIFDHFRNKELDLAEKRGTYLLSLLKDYESYEDVVVEYKTQFYQIKQGKFILNITDNNKILDKVEINDHQMAIYYKGIDGNISCDIKDVQYVEINDDEDDNNKDKKDKNKHKQVNKKDTEISN